MNFVGRWDDRRECGELLVLQPGPHVRRIESGDSSMIVLGHCLASDAQLLAALRSVRETGRTHDTLGGGPGCYSLAVFLPDRVLLLTDPVGQFPIYTARTAGGMWFGSSVVEIAGHVNAAVDRVRLAMGIACIDVLDVTDNTSVFTSVHRVSLGHVFSLTADGVAGRPWNPIVPDRRMTFSEAADRLRLSLPAAVAARASSVRRIAGDLSGGIDSSALIFLTLRTGMGVSGITFHQSEAAQEDDLAWARRHAALAPGLAHHLVAATDDDLPYQDLAASSGEPHPSSLAVGPLRARLRLAVARGAEVYLVGEGGDVVIGAPPAYLADIARQGKPVELWRHCLRWGRIRQCSPFVLARRAVLLATTSRRHALTSLAGSLDRPGRVGLVPPWHVSAIGYWDHAHASWLPKRTRAEVAERVRAMADEPSAADLGIADAVTLSQLRTQVMTQQAVREAGAELGLAVHAPFLDTEVVRACLALPAYRRADPTTPKPLLRAALDGLVPEPVLTRPTKGNYVRGFHLGVRRAAHELRGLLREPVAADLGILDPVPVRAVLERAIQGLPTPWRALNQVFAVELWLRDVSRKVSAG